MRLRQNGGHDYGRPNRHNNQTLDLFLLVFVHLIFSHLWRMLVTANQYPGQTATFLSMLADACSVLGPAGLRNQLNAARPPDDARRSKINVAMGFGITAGISLFLIRFTSEAAWWTGHLHYSVD